MVTPFPLSCPGLPASLFHLSPCGLLTTWASSEFLFSAFLLCFVHSRFLSLDLAIYWFFYAIQAAAPVRLFPKSLGGLQIFFSLMITFATLHSAHLLPHIASQTIPHICVIGMTSNPCLVST